MSIIPNRNGLRLLAVAGFSLTSAQYAIAQDQSDQDPFALTEASCTAVALGARIDRSRIGEPVSGVALEKTHLLGRFLRATPVAPPLSQRGRFQTFVQMVRWDASNRALVAGLRDPTVLRAIIYNAERDITDKNVIRILTQTGATGLAIGDDGLLPQEYQGKAK